MTPRPLLRLALALALLAPAVPARAQDADEDLQAYARELEAARASLGEGSWRAADDAWSALLAAHAGHAHARTEVEEMRLALKRARFWRTTSEPRLDEHISGKLARDPRGNGRVHVIYTPETLGDFERTEVAGQTVHAHPAHFSGPWSIQAEGDPETLSQVSWLVMRGERGLGLRAGLRREGSLMYTAHLAWDASGGEVEVLVEEEPRETKGSASRMRVEVRVGKRRVELFVDGKEVLEVPREGEDFGQLTWSAAAAPARLELKGEVERGWLDGVRDAAVSETWRAFEEAWEDPPEFAAWGELVEEPEVELDLDELVKQIGVRVEFLPAQQRVFEQFEPFLGKGWQESRAVLENVDGLPDGALPPGAVAFLTYAASLDLGRWQAALAALPDLTPLEGREMQFALLRSVVLERADRLDEARACLEAALEADPDVAALHSRLVEVQLLAGQPDAARAALDEGRRRLPASRSLLEREGQVVRATVGPPWKRVHEHEGRHFLVRSEVGPKVSREAAAVLDAALEHCEARLGPLPEGTPRSVAYVFAGSRGYLEYVEGIADSSQENTLGIYSPLLAQVAVWNQPDEAALWDTLRHEAVHRYLHVRAGSLPRWLHEGLAESIASELSEPDAEPVGRVRRTWVAVLRSQGGSVDLLQRFAYDDSEFAAAIERNYALSWSWVHFLRFEDDEGREVFDALWRGVAAGEDVNVALDAALEGRDVNALQLRFVDFLNGLLAG